MSALTGCPLCRREGDAATREIAADDRLRVVRVLDAPDFPAYYRVVWHAHAAEFTDLTPPERAHCMAAVAAVEGALREALAPAKVNLAALGNQVPHLHWHVVARFGWDSHFPQPIWGQRQREPAPAELARLTAALPALDEAIRRALAALAA